MFRRYLLANLVLGSLVGACTKDGRSLVPVNVDLAGTTVPATMRVLLSRRPLADDWHVHDPWQTGPGQVREFGIYLPPDVRGLVNATACGFDDNHRLTSFGTGNEVAVTPGHASELVTVMLNETGPTPDGCINTGAGGRGGGG